MIENGGMIKKIRTLVSDFWNGETVVIPERRTTTTIIDPPQPFNIESLIQESSIRNIVGLGHSLHISQPESWMLKVTKERNPKNIRNHLIFSHLIFLGDGEYAVFLIDSNHKRENPK